MIPKKIHYCWFGQGDMPLLNKACLGTWSEPLKEYEIKRWDESNCPRNDFINFHLEQKNWAFVSDYVRLFALYTEGGIYLDTDFEVLKSFDPLLRNAGFIGLEAEDRMNNAIAGSIEGEPFFKDCMDYIMKRFESGLDYHISPLVTTNVYNSKVYDITVYPAEFFYPYNPYDLDRGIKVLMQNMLVENTHAIHHWAKSWSEIEPKTPELKRGLVRGFLRRLFYKLATLL